jgi:hypothetical protein
MVLRGYWGDHAFDVEFFNRNHTVAIDQPSCGLVNEIVAAVANALMDTRDNFAGFLSLAAPALLFGKFALRFCQSLLFGTKEARIFDVLTVGQRRKGFQPNVKSDFLSRRRQEFGFVLCRETNEPLGIDAANRTGFDVAVNRAMLANGYVPNLGQSEFALVEAKAALRVSERVVPVAFDAGIAWGLARFHAPKEGLERKVYPLGYVLQDLRIYVGQLRVRWLPCRDCPLLLNPSGGLCR